MGVAWDLTLVRLELLALATRLELKFTDRGSTSILNLYGARVGCPAWAVFVFVVLPPLGAPMGPSYYSRD